MTIKWSHLVENKDGGFSIFSEPVLTKLCHVCDGSGEGPWQGTRCRVCNGNGEIEIPLDDLEDDEF